IDRRAVAQQFRRLAAIMRGLCDGGTPQRREREEFPLTQQAGRLLIPCIEKGWLEVSPRFKALVKEAQEAVRTKPGRPRWAVVSMTDPGARIMRAFVDLIQTGRASGLVREEPGGLSRFNNFDHNAAQTDALIAGRMRTLADACERIADELDLAESGGNG